MSGPAATDDAVNTLQGWCRVRVGRVLAAASLTLVAACGSSVAPAGSTATSPAAPIRGGDVLPSPVALPPAAASAARVSAAAFSASDGTRPTLAQLQQGHLMLVFFGYTHCPDVCPTTMANLGVALRSAPADVQRAVRVVFVTSDPYRDKPAALKAWLSNFDAGLPQPFLGLTAPATQILAAAGALGVPLVPTGKNPDGSTSYDHGTQVLAFQNGVAKVLWLAATTPQDYTHDLTTLVRDPASVHA